MERGRRAPAISTVSKPLGWAAFVSGHADRGSGVGARAERRRVDDAPALECPHDCGVQFDLDAAALTAVALSPRRDHCAAVCRVVGAVDDLDAFPRIEPLPPVRPNSLMAVVTGPEA